MLGLILLIFAFVFALIQAFRPWVAPPPNPWGIPHLGWAAAALVILTLILGQGIR